MSYLDLSTGIKKCGNANCLETDPAAFGSCKTWLDGLAHVCKACARERSLRYMKAHRHVAYTRSRIWEKANPDKLKAKKQRLRITSARFRATEAAYNRRRRALKESLPSLWSSEMWSECLAAFNSCCAYCGVPKTVERDHFVPLCAKWLPEGYDRPGDVPWNIVPACMACNRGKHHEEPIKWLTRTGRIDRLLTILEYLRAMRKKYDTV